jgi:hypothetical protein
VSLGITAVTSRSFCFCASSVDLARQWQQALSAEIEAANSQVAAMGLVQPKGGADDSRLSNMLSGSIPPFLLGGVMSSTQAAAGAAAVEDSGEEADDYCDVFDAEEWQIRDLSVGEHAVEEQRMPEQRRPSAPG